MNKTILFSLSSILLLVGCSSGNKPFELEEKKEKEVYYKIEDKKICFNSMTKSDKNKKTIFREKVNCDNKKIEFETINKLTSLNFVLVSGFSKKEVKEEIELIRDKIELLEEEIYYISEKKTKYKLDIKYVGLYYSFKDDKCFLMDNYKNERKTPFSCEKY